MRILVLVTSYPRPDGSVTLQYIHSRNQQYVQQGIDVSVISFDAEADYEIDQIKVYTLNTYQNTLKNEHFDLLVSHAPNLRNHYLFIKKFGHLYNQFVFFFHGHEILKTTEVYPDPYDYAEKTPIATKLKKQLYDHVKLLVWRSYFKKIAHKSHFVFVSNWMYRMFLDSVKINPSYIEDKMSIIYNGIGSNFEKYSYDPDKPKKYDFITIRNNLDGPKYAIDIVTEVARQNPQYHFCVIGTGNFYNYNEQPVNLEWIDKVLSHDEIISSLNDARCALLPTRVDSQGVMACEFATFGIPMITSDINICTEMFESFPNVGYISNYVRENQLETLFNQLTIGSPYNKNEKFFSRNTIMQEVELFKNLSRNKSK